MSAGSWYNTDGLFLEYGTTKAANDKAGWYPTKGGLREIETVFDLTSAISTAGGFIISDWTKVPTGMRIQEIEVQVQTACSGSGALLNLGLIQEDRSTEIDNDGLLIQLPMTSVSTQGQTLVIRQGSSFAGALVGSSVANVGQLVADWDTAAFTAGTLRIKIRMYQHAAITQ